MINATYLPAMFQAILPEILILILAVIIMVVDFILPFEKRRFLGWVTAVGLLGIAVASLLFGMPGSQPASVWGGMIRHDWMGFIFQMLFLFSAAITALFSMDVDRLGQRGEFYVLLLASTIGMNLMASAGNIVMLYLAVETTSMPLYILAGFLTRDEKSTESGFKYMLFGALTSTIMVYGFSLLYGFSGKLDFIDLGKFIGDTVQTGKDLVPVMGSLLLILVGFGFKVSVVPFHFWAPDVYEGSPTPVAGFLSTASKAAGFSVLMRILFVAFPAASGNWSNLLAIMSVATMTLGNALALAQKNIKRMLAYSSIAHAGYALIGLVAFSPLGVTSVIFYMSAYLITNLAAFGVVTAVSRVTCSDEIASYAGLSRRSPGLALAMMVSFLSLAGMPPLGGFISKLFVFAAAVQNPALIWLAFVGVLNSIIGLYYYLTVLKVVYLYRGPDEEQPLPIPRNYVMALGILALGIILIGTIFGPWYSLSNAAAAAMF